ncbi:MAG: DNA double-strand break repair nuclease NurA, partial [Candidatus Bathyarchaeia archaeon]
MPGFLDLFIREVRGKKDGMREGLEKGRTSLLDEDLKALFNQHWHPLPKGEIGGLHLLAVDGSVGLREYANGSRFYVTRAYGITNRREKFRQLETGVFLSRGNEKDVGRYISQKTEYVEMKTALEAVPNLKGAEKLILIDGSLYGRMMHPLMDSPVDGDRAFLLEYMNLYAKLFKECRDADVLLVGVSKDSRAEFLRDEFLRQICSKELQGLRTSLSSEEIRALERCIEDLEESPDSSFRIFHVLRRKHGPLLDRFEQILLEFLHAGSDFQLVLNFASQPGHSTP